MDNIFVSLVLRALYIIMMQNMGYRMSGQFGSWKRISDEYQGLSDKPVKETVANPKASEYYAK